VRGKKMRGGEKRGVVRESSTPKVEETYFGSQRSQSLWSRVGKNPNITY
jgi:hypothetical protein